MIATRGERLNNPGNLEKGAIAWQGMAQDQPDSRFVKFNRPEDGIRALAKVLLTNYRKHGLNTVRKIVNRWAPPHENDTGAYANHVADLLGVDDEALIVVSDPLILEGLTRGIIAHENGRVIYSDAEIVSAIDKALA